MDAPNPVYVAARALLEASRLAQVYGGDDRHGGSSPAWIAERCTVRVGGPRRAGHTTAAGCLARDLGLPALYLAAFGHQHLVAGESRLAAFRARHTVEALLKSNDFLRGMPLELVVVDGASMLSPADLAGVVRQTIECMSYAQAKYYLLLG